MKTPNLTSKIHILAISLFIPVIGFIFPHASLASEPIASNNSVMVFELKPDALNTGLSMSDITSNDELVKSLQDYLESKGSPLAPYADQIVTLPQWQHALGITFVESNYCKRAANFNCGSVGVKPGHSQWRQFTTPYDGFKAVSDLLEKPIYKDKYNTCKKKLKVYVVPGSPNWLRGCEKVEKEMNELTAKAEATRLAKLNTTTTGTIINKELALAN